MFKEIGALISRLNHFDPYLGAKEYEIEKYTVLSDLLTQKRSSIALVIFLSQNVNDSFKYYMTYYLI